MTRKRIVLVVVLLVAFGAVIYFYGGHTTPKGQPPLVSFSSGDLTPLKTAFNGSASSIRVVVMLSPTKRPCWKPPQRARVKLKKNGSMPRTPGTCVRYRPPRPST